jgi:hypothetical protein
MALTTVWAMWAGVILYVAIVDACVFLIAGVIAAAVHVRASARWLAAPPLAALLGALVAILYGAVPAVLLAALYVALPAAMSRAAAAGWGSAIGVAIAVVNTGAFRKIL